MIQRPQLNKDFSAQRAYSNAFEPTADMFPLFVRATYCKHSPVAVWKSTIPDGYRTVLIPTHDCDSRTAYDAMHFMAEYEQSIGLSGQYFLTTHYYRDSPYLSAFYDQPSVEKSRQLLQLGQTIGSHSICHFPDFNKTDRFPLTEYTRQTYHATHNLETGITTDGSTWAEIVLSKHILEEDLGCTVKSFRSGHLCVNKNFPQALEMGEYGFSSCYGAGDVLTCFPYLERIGNEWVGRQSTVLQMPLHFSDVLYDDPMTEDNWHEKPARWLRLMEKLQGNFAPSMLLIHPNREWKMLSEKMLVEHMDRTTMGIYNFEDYGHFWLQRRQLQHTFAHNQAHDKIVIRATRAEFDANPHLSFVIHTATAQPPRQVVLIDEHSMALPLSVHTLSPGTYIAVRE